MYVPRILGRHILEVSRSFSVVLVAGPRQAGKTTLLEHLGAADSQLRVVPVGDVM